MRTLRLPFCAALTGLLLATLPNVAHAQKTDLKEQRHLVELGLYLGGFFPSSKHKLYNPGTAVLREFDAGAFDIGLRAAYLPIPYVGVELELGMMPTATSNDEFAMLYTFRGHVIG